MYNMKKHLVTILLVLVLFVGVALVAYPTFSDWWNSNIASHAVVNYESALAELAPEDYTALFDAAEDYNARLHALDNPLVQYEEIEGYSEQLSIDGGSLMGYIEIEKINVLLPIKHGTASDVLANNVGHMEGSSLPIGGESTHTVLSAHRGLPSARLFTDLDKMEVGDIFTVTVLDRTLTYQVDQIIITDPYDMELLSIVDGEDYCTLLTCTPYGINTHRMLVRGTRIENIAQASKVHITAELQRIDPLIVALFIGVPLILLFYIDLIISDKINAKYGLEDEDA